MRVLLKFLVFLSFFLFTEKISENLPDSRGFTQLIFEENFNGDKLNDKKWNHEIGPRHSAINSFESIFVNGGVLEIRPFVKNDKIFSGIINTRQKFEFNKGKIEIRAKFNPKKGCWSAGWLYADSVALNEQNYEINGLEIDIWENRLFDYNGKNIGDFVNQGFHFNGYGKFHKSAGTDSGNTGLNDGDFHVFELIWEENLFVFLIDKKVSFVKKNLDTEKKLFLVLSVEIGKIPGWTHGPEDFDGENILSVDYVRVWKHPADSQN